MGKFKALVDVHGERAVEFAIWMAAPSALGDDLGGTVADAVMSDGLWGVSDLVFAGPVFGGLGAEDLGELAAQVEADLGELLAA